MRRSVALTLVLLAATAIVAALALAPGAPRPPPPPAAAVPEAEHAATIEALRPRRAGRPAIAIVALNEGTEVADLTTTFGVLREADVADVEIVAPRAGTLELYPALRAEPDATMQAFDRRRPDGADYVIVPAMSPADDPRVLDWIRAQQGKGAIIVSVCNGALTLSAAGLLDGRRATAHWWSVSRLRKAHPTMRWAPDRR